MHTRYSLVLGAAATIFASCGNANQAAVAPQNTPADSTTAAVPPGAGHSGAVWSDAMSKEAKMAFMKSNVLPTMSKVFLAQNATRYAKVECTTCHGPQYKEPKEFLPRLTLSGGKLTAFSEKPEIAKFMADKVVPEMAAAMGLKPYDPQTKQGFGCAGCHAIDMK
jgi:hypothetical protein